ncbi:MAG: hypothetical protein LC644_05910, partial [Pseudonocardia sp.]|nr:hypothetical protein [Pseudonocardia sp.]
LMRRIRRVRPVLPPPSAFTGFRFPREVIVLVVRSMPLSLAGDFEEVDLGWAVVELAVVGGAFEAVVVGSVSFDYSGICSVSSWGLGRSVISWVVSVSAVASVLGGKARLVGDLAADGAVAADKG